MAEHRVVSRSLPIMHDSYLRDFTSQPRATLSGGPVHAVVRHLLAKNHGCNSHLWVPSLRVPGLPPTASRSGVRSTTPAYAAHFGSAMPGLTPRTTRLEVLGELPVPLKLDATGQRDCGREWV